MTIKQLKRKFRSQQIKIAEVAGRLHHMKRRRNDTFQMLMQRIYGFKPGDKIRFLGKKRWFRGKFESYAIPDNEAIDLTRCPAADVSAWFEADDRNRYMVDPLLIERETDPEEL